MKDDSIKIEIENEEKIENTEVKGENDMESENKKLPYLFEFYKTTDLYKEFSVKENPLYSYYNNENGLPEEFAAVVRNKCF